jgi:hypothetical protein
VQHSVNQRRYALRARIERFFSKLKNHRRVATPYDQTSISFLGYVPLGCIRIWIRFGHAAWINAAGSVTRTNKPIGPYAEPTIANGANATSVIRHRCARTG